MLRLLVLAPAPSAAFVAVVLAAAHRLGVEGPLPPLEAITVAVALLAATAEFPVLAWWAFRRRWRLVAAGAVTGTLTIVLVIGAFVIDPGTLLYAT